MSIPLDSLFLSRVKHVLGHGPNTLTPTLRIYLAALLVTLSCSTFNDAHHLAGHKSLQLMRRRSFNEEISYLLCRLASMRQHPELKASCLYHRGDSIIHLLIHLTSRMCTSYVFWAYSIHHHAECQSHWGPDNREHHSRRTSRILYLCVGHEEDWNHVGRYQHGEHSGTVPEPVI